MANLTQDDAPSYRPETPGPEQPSPLDFRDLVAWMDREPDPDRDEPPAIDFHLTGDPFDAVTFPEGGAR